MRTLFYAKHSRPLKRLYIIRKAGAVRTREPKKDNSYISRVEYRQERQLYGSENHRRNCALAAAGIRHSHSIVPGGFEVTS